MNNKIFVKPKRKELIVIKPNGQRLKAAGEYVAAEVYWQRRINDNEVEVVTPKKKGN
jgi:hypothetical protein|nr:MAG TPA: Protein of unknown function (DUF2635) [Caudoviricetes sp.]